MVSVDRVYQTVLDLLNKEQRGYLTPDEFNNFATQAQIEIFEGYFHDLDLHLELAKNDDGYADIVKNLEEKIVIFETSANLTEDTGTNNVFSDPSNLYRLGRVFLNDINADMVSHKDAAYIRLSPLTSPTTKQPVYIRTGQGFRLLFSQTDASMMTDTDVVRIEYIRRPASPVWSGAVMDGQIVVNSSGSTDFELHPSEAPELVMKILAMAGLAVKAPDVIQFAQGMASVLDQEEKQ